jgi:hypothetical protein
MVGLLPRRVFELVIEPSLTVGLLPRRAMSGDGALPNGWATAPARVEW